MNKNNPQSELAMLRDPSSKKSKKDIKVSKITIAKLKDPSDRLSNIDVKGKKGG